MSGDRVRFVNMGNLLYDRAEGGSGCIDGGRLGGYTTSSFSMSEIFIQLVHELKY